MYAHHHTSLSKIYHEWSLFNTIVKQHCVLVCQRLFLSLSDAIVFINYHFYHCHMPLLLLVILVIINCHQVLLVNNGYMEFKKFTYK